MRKSAQAPPPPDERAKLAEALLATRRAIAARKARDDLLTFTKLMHPDPEAPDDPDRSLYQVAPHHALLAAAREKVSRGEIMKLCISIGPQFGKSELFSRQGIAWDIGREPWKHWIVGTYNEGFAWEFGDDVRNILQRPQFGQIFPGVGLRTGSKAKDHMVTTRGGKISFVGRGGSTTGRPADRLVVDDPIKNAEEAASLTIRNSVWTWFTRTLNSRCHGLTTQIVIQTRWHEDDLIGRLTDPKNPHYNADVAKQWTYINIPALIETADDLSIVEAMGLKIGDSLWETRFPRKLLETARLMDPVGFSALYQGRPTPPEGAFYKQSDFHAYSSITALPEGMAWYGAGDFAVSPDLKRDKTCVGNWGVDSKGNLWLHPDLYWERKTADDSVETMLDMAARMNWQTFFTERGVIWKTLEQFVLKRMQERGIAINCEALSVGGNKGARSTSIRGRMRQGKVFFPSFAPWWSEAKNELLKFTGSGDDLSDDFCDMIAMIGNGLSLQLHGRKPDQGERSNVIRPGTWGDLKRHMEHERARRKAASARRGW